MSDSSARCPICGSDELVEFSGRPAARCASCGALERHRALARSQSEVLGRGADRAALEVGPLNPEVFGRYLRDRGWRYMSTDQSFHGNAADPRAVGFIDFEADLCDLSAIADDAMQLVMAQHVIEEIPEYWRALAEVARVLSSDGVALLEIPFDPRRERSERQAADHFGNLWRFGADLPDRLREHFSEVEVASLREGSYSGALLVCRHGG